MSNVNPQDWVTRTLNRKSKVVQPFSEADDKMKARFNDLNPIIPKPRRSQPRSSMNPDEEPSPPLPPFPNVPPDIDEEAHSHMPAWKRKDREDQVVQAEALRQVHDAPVKNPNWSWGGRRRKSRKSRKPRKTKRRKSKKTKRRRTKRRR